MKKTAFILAVLLVVGIVMAQNKVNIVKVDATPTGPQTAANSDSVTCATNTCVPDGSFITFGAKADAKSTATDTTAITAMQVLKEISAMVQVPPPSAGTLASGAVTTAMTGTTSTSVIGATASNYIYVTQCTVSNASLTVSTDIILQDGSGGTTLYNIPAPAATVATTGGAGAVVSFPVPLKVTTVGNALFAANVTTGSSTKIACSGFKSTVSY